MLTEIQVKLNCMSLEHLEHEGIGICLDPLAAKMNHSCDPNAFVFFEGSQIRVRSLRPICPGDEVTISYINNTLQRPYRKALLESKWFFNCECM